MFMFTGSRRPPLVRWRRWTGGCTAAVPVFVVMATGLTLSSYRVFYGGFTHLTNYSKSPG
ncbi:MAG: hypothetical protein RXR82_05195 [Nitrososphaeria archaeon]